MNRLLLSVAVCVVIIGTAVGQNIKEHYVAKTEADGTIYHPLPSALFENRKTGDLIFEMIWMNERY